MKHIDKVLQTCGKSHETIGKRIITRSSFPLASRNVTISFAKEPLTMKGARTYRRAQIGCLNWGEETYYCELILRQPPLPAGKFHRLFLPRRVPLPQCRH